MGARFQHQSVIFSAFERHTLKYRLQRLKRGYRVTHHEIFRLAVLLRCRHCDLFRCICVPRSLELSGCERMVDVDDHHCGLVRADCLSVLVHWALVSSLGAETVTFLSTVNVSLGSSAKRGIRRLIATPRSEKSPSHILQCKCLTAGFSECEELT